MKALGLPLLVFSCIEFLMAQSQHYQMPDLKIAPRGAEHYLAGTNIAIPHPLAFMMLFTNLHATHHSRPAVKWYQTPAMLVEDIRQGTAGQPTNFLAFLINWFAVGAKVNRAAGEVKESI